MGTKHKQQIEGIEMLALQTQQHAPNAIHDVITYTVHAAGATRALTHSLENAIAVGTQYAEMGYGVQISDGASTIARTVDACDGCGQHIECDCETVDSIMGLLGF
jgi:hypothetical protein